MVERQSAGLNDELTAKVNNSFEMRRKHTELEAGTASRLADVERQLSECSESLQWNTDKERELEMKLKSGHEELTSAKDSAAANEQNLYKELSISHLKQIEDDYRQKPEKESAAKKQFEKAAGLKAKLESCEGEIERSKKNEVVFL